MFQVEGTSDVYSYDAAANCWQQKACMQEHRAKLAATSLGKMPSFLCDCFLIVVQR